MELAFIVIPILAVSAYLTSVACRFAHNRQRRPAWYLVVVSGIATAVLIVCVGYLGILSVPGDVPKIGGLRYWGRIVPALFAFSALLALLPGFVVILFYRRRHSTGEDVI
jgi:hypothetical protein